MHTIKKQLLVLVYAEKNRRSDALLSLLSGMQMIQEIDRIDNFEQAVAIIAKKKTDLVLVDMPLDEKGLELFLQTIKETDANVYCLSVVDTIHLSRISKQNGADHVLLRGFSGNELLEVIFKAQTHQLNLENKLMENKATFIIK